MQEYKHGKLINTISGKTPQELAALMADDSTHVVIGRLPTRGKLVTINGLLFVVLSKSDKKGTIHLELVKPKDQKP